MPNPSVPYRSLFIQTESGLDLRVMPSELGMLEVISSWLCPMKFTKLFVIAAIALSLTSCGVVDYMTDKFEATERIQSDLAMHGWDDAQVGWKINNGTLQYVSVQLEAKDVRSETVGELEKVVQTSVVEHLKKEPNSLVISIVAKSNTQ